MAERRVGIVFVGATGELARRQHLPGLAAIRNEGGLLLTNGDRLVPDVILVGRDEERLADVAAETGFERFSTDAAAVLTESNSAIYFDAAPSGGRVARAMQAIAAGRHVYLEKPIAPSLEEALALARAAADAGVKHGTVQDKLFLPGFQALLELRRSGFSAAC